MKNLLMLFKIYHVIIILTFLLPFAVIDCYGPSAKDIAEKAKEDSIKQADSLNNIDTLKCKNYLTDTTQLNNVNKDTLPKETVSDTLKSENKYLKSIEKYAELVLYDNQNHYTGVGVFYFGIGLISFIGIFNAFILILISCLMVFIIKLRNFKTILIIDVFGIVFLISSIGKYILWGYWVCLFCWIGLIILDIVVFRKSKILLTSDHT